MCENWDPSGPDCRLAGCLFDGNIVIPINTQPHGFCSAVLLHMRKRRSRMTAKLMGRCVWLRECVDSLARRCLGEQPGTHQVTVMLRLP